MTESYEPTPSARPTGSKALLIVAWLIVGLPALWGVSKTVQTSMKLFNPPASTQPAVITAPVIPPATSPS